MRFDPGLALSPAQRRRLIEGDITDVAGVLRIETALDAAALDGADTLFNARVLLSALVEGPCRLTKQLGNLERRFVERMADEMRRPPDEVGFLRRYKTRLGEEDFPELHILRTVLAVAGLTKKRNGHLSLTKRGAGLVAPERQGELWAHLVRTYFGRFNIFYGRGFRDDPLMQRHMAYTLWWIGERARRPVPTAEIGTVLSHDLAQWGDREDRYLHAVALLLLEPLEALGLLRREPQQKPRWAPGAPSWYASCTWEVTPLFHWALSFDLGPIAGGAAADDAGAQAAGDHPNASPAGERRAIDLDARRGRAKGEKARHLRVVESVEGEEPLQSAGGGPAQADAGRIAQLTITLLDTSPAVWRRLEVPLDVTFERLHAYLNAAMGWEDCHLHMFVVGDRSISSGDADWELEPQVEDESRVTLEQVLATTLRRARPEFVYQYDFGDDWQHLVAVEAVREADESFYPRCTDGARACPPEDCGGSPGYAELLAALTQPAHPEHDERRAWLLDAFGIADFDPEAFELEGVNRLLHIAATGKIGPDDLDYFAPSE